MSNYKIIQQRIRCIGCAACKEAAPERWAMSMVDGKSTLIGSTMKKGYAMVQIREEELQANLLALKNCPVNIIQIIAERS